MTAKWLWGSVPIYVAEQEISREVKRAELFPLDSPTSLFHFFGAGSEHDSITGLVIGETNKDSIIADAIAGTTRTLTTPYGNKASAAINGSPKFQAKLYGGATIDGTVYDPETTALYDATLEIVLT